MVNLDEWDRTGGFDTIDRELAMRPEVIGGVKVMGATNAGRDFWLVEHAERIMATVSGFAFSGLFNIIPDTLAFTPKKSATARFYEREQYEGTIARAKELADRFVYYATEVQPFSLEYYPGMPEADLRKWAAGVNSALQK